MPTLLRCSKPSRWRQPPRVTRKSQQEQSPSATKCNHSSKYTWNHSISLWMHNQERGEWERFASAHMDVSMIKISKRVSPIRPTSIYRAPNKAPLAVELRINRDLRTFFRVRRLPATIAHAPHVLAFEFNCCHTPTTPCWAPD
jgi:hypothetical protein